MRYASFGRRIVGGMIDYVIISIILYTIACVLVVGLWGGNGMEEAPFMAMEMIIIPLGSLMRLLRDSWDRIYYMLFAIFYIVEVMYYSLLEISPLKDTIGHHCMKISISATEGKVINTYNIILRNSFKTLSRYLFLTPLLSILFTKQKQSFYDMISNIIVVKKQV